MAKRFTDTEKWKHGRFMKLSLELKCAWFYLLDNCDHAGVWPINLELLNFQVGSNLSLEDLLENLAVSRVGEESLYITNFVSFQYNVKSWQEIEPRNNTLKSVIKRLSSLVEETTQTQFPFDLDSSHVRTRPPVVHGPHREKPKTNPSLNPCPRVQDTGLDLDLYEDSDVNKDSEGEKNFDFDSLHKLYPIKDNKEAAIKAMKEVIHTESQFYLLRAAIKNYAAEKEGVQPKFIKSLPNFMKVWEDWRPETAEEMCKRMGLTMPQVEYIGMERWEALMAEKDKKMGK